ncbi:MAG TPA: HAD family phosphatase [Anaerohalosphaeraceae bacterium]|nr:HAD family phosphatase [Anaerohalosphaeraceae bacterium]HOL31849.1 HAD family phosphatase [Anaerohalosphaeraceae bacterium]HOM75081.1 HAD family phosphatase [Anaerohalosphaeraceae bacterium]HPO68953.1 HAD family phosphatase [Anaerohalosphaeraceae bacterium]HRS71141.1 HAD family phosphatase [Anaerohalosphaeraceae bacterium]
MNMTDNTWGVIFDVDGTMVNNTAYHRAAWFELCRRYGIPMDHKSYHEKIHARSNDKIVPNLFGPSADQEFICRIENEKETIYRESFRPVMQENPGLSDLLQSLVKRGIACGAASNSPKENVDFILDGLNLRSYFRAVTFRDMVKAGKPDPELFLRAAQLLGIPPQRCLVFEDSASGFKAARAAGMRYIAITLGGDSHELAEAYDAAAICEDFTSVNADTLAKLFKQ